MTDVTDVTTTESQPPPVDKPDIRLIKLSELYVNPHYQREINFVWVNYLVKNWDPGKVAWPIVSPDYPRTDPPYAVIDGQQRTHAARRLGIEELFCDLRFLDQKGQAALFLTTNNERKPTKAIDTYRAQLVIEDPVAVKVQKALEAHHLHFTASKSKNPRDVTSVVALRKMAESGATHLDNVLDIVLRSWPNDPSATHAVVLYGVDLFLRVYEGTPIDHEEIIRKLQATSATEFVQMAKSGPMRSGSDSSTQVGRAVLYYYNLRRTSRRLPDLFDVNRRPPRHDNG